MVVVADEVVADKVIGCWIAALQSDSEMALLRSLSATQVRTADVPDVVDSLHLATALDVHVTHLHS